MDETICFAALDASGEVVGAALAFTYRAGADRGRSAEIAVSVAPEHRRRGLGSDLAARVCDAVAQCGADAAVFKFDASNSAIRGVAVQGEAHEQVADPALGFGPGAWQRLHDGMRTDLSCAALHSCVAFPQRASAMSLICDRT